MIKTYLIRIIMFVLFVAALVTTYETVTGLKIHAATINVKQTFFATQMNTLSNALEKNKTDLHKTASMQSNKVKPVTAVKSVKTLAESRNWKDYPSKKVTATGYTAGYESTGKYASDPSYGITYSGVKVKRDLYSTIAADPRVFPIGTILWIPGYGLGVVADTGGAIKGNRLDLYYDTVADVYAHWGKKDLDVYVIKKGKGKFSETEFKKLNEDKSMQVFRQQINKQNQQ